MFSIPIFLRVALNESSFDNGTKQYKSELQFKTQKLNSEVTYYENRT